jgi:hypothetical protein
MLEVAVRDAGVSYEDFIALVEDDGSVPEEKHSFPPRANAGLPGKILWVTEGDANAERRRKLRDDQASTRQIKGHVSYHPPAELTPTTCALVIGTRRFLARQARYYFEERGLLREKAFDAMEVICGLKSVGEVLQPEDFVQVNVWEKEFYPGSFDHLVQRVLGRAAARRLALPA